MNASMNCLFERVSNLSAAVILWTAGLGLCGEGTAIPPVFGLMLTGTILAASAGFAEAHRRRVSCIN